MSSTILNLLNSLIGYALNIQEDAWSNRVLLSSALTTAAVVGVAAYLWQCWRHSQRLPPGPTGLPLLGRLPWVNAKQLHLSMMRESEKYGDLCSFYLGSRLFIIVNSYELMKDMLEDPMFAGRPRLRLIEKGTHGCGIIFTEGDKWSQHRRLSLRTLRDFGFARTRTVEMIDDQLDSIFQTFDRASDDSVSVLDTLLLASNAVITELTLGHRFDHADQTLVKVNALLKKMIESGFTQAASVLFPAVEKLVDLLPRSIESIRDVEFLHEFIRQEIREREALMKQGAEAECLCDIYLQEKTKAEMAGDMETFKEFQIIRVCFEFYFAGTDTTARSIEWLLLYMAFYPEVQQRVQQELDNVVGQSRRPRMQDKTELHYTCAVIDECYRMVSLTPTGLFHRAMEDTQFRGRRIPKDAFIIPLVYGIHHRADYWAKPNEFYPEHFLDENGRYRSSQYLVPFLIGRRACLGESLARMEIFLFFTALMQRYRVRPAPESAVRKDEILLGHLGTVRVPGDYWFSIKRRYL